MPKIKDKLERFEYLTLTQQENKMGIFSDAADKVKAEQIAAGWRPFVPPVGAAAPTSEPPPVYRTFTLADGREYEARYLAGRCSSGAEGGGGWLHHAVIVGGDSVAFCGAKPGSRRSAGFALPAPHHEAEITCTRCLNKIAKLNL